MNIVQITPGAGGMYCGGCFHDNALVTALRRFGHETLMLPLYLPLRLDEPDQSAGMPVFFGGISVYLGQKLPWWRHLPRSMRQLLAARSLLQWAAGRAAKTRAEEVGELTLSMLRGEAGRQACEIEDLVAWLRSQPGPEVICLSNALLTGMARRLRSELRVPIVCLLQGEDSFVDGLPAGAREAAWAALAERAADVDRYIAPSRYYAERMAERLRVPLGRVAVVPNGINLDGFGGDPAGSERDADPANEAPVIGFFSRMCPEKGLDTLVEAFVLLKGRAGLERCRLHVGGGCGPGDEPFVGQMRRRLVAAGVAGDVEFFPNLDRPGKLAFLRGLTLFSVPALYGEAFGLYVIEALAAGVPVVQPRHAGFPEVVEATGGGVLYEPGGPEILANALAELLQDPARARRLGEAGRERVRTEFSAERMAGNTAAVFAEAIQSFAMAKSPAAQ